LVDVYAMDPHCKPNREAYQLAMNLSETSDPTTCAMLDDSAHNLAPAKDMGFFTILVGQNGTHPSADRSLENIINLPKEVPEFWD